MTLSYFPRNQDSKTVTMFSSDLYDELVRETQVTLAPKPIFN